MSIKINFRAAAAAVTAAVVLAGCDIIGPANNANPNFVTAKELNLITSPILPIVEYLDSTEFAYTVARLDCQNGVLMTRSGGAIDITLGPSGPQRAEAARADCLRQGHTPGF